MKRRFARRQSTASAPAAQVVPFARKSSVRREPNVDPSEEPRPPKAPPRLPPLLGCRSTMAISKIEISSVSATITQKNMVFDRLMNW
jgi:hypothetical protein